MGEAVHPPRGARVEVLFGIELARGRQPVDDPGAAGNQCIEELVGALAERADNAATGDCDAHVPAGALASAKRQPHRVADTLDRAQLAVPDLHAEAVLERRDELDELERVDVEIAPLRFHRRLVRAGNLQLGELRTDALEYLFLCECHYLLLVSTLSSTRRCRDPGPSFHALTAAPQTKPAPNATIATSEPGSINPSR